MYAVARFFISGKGESEAEKPVRLGEELRLNCLRGAQGGHPFFVACSRLRFGLGGFQIGDALGSALDLADVFVGEGDWDGDGSLAGARVLPFDLKDEREGGGLFGEEDGNLYGIETEI